MLYHTQTKIWLSLYFKQHAMYTKTLTWRICSNIEHYSIVYKNIYSSLWLVLVKTNIESFCVNNMSVARPLANEELNLP